MTQVIDKHHPQWLAFVRLGQLQSMESVGFAPLVCLARDLGLLETILAGNTDVVSKVISEMKEELMVEIEDWNRKMGSEHLNRPFELAPS